MSNPQQFRPPQKQPASGSGQMAAFVLLALGLVSMLCCGGACGGLFLFIRSAPTMLAQVKSSIEERVTAPLVSPKWADDWVVMERLSRTYTTSLDAVAAHGTVIERLGEPIEPQNEPDRLFRRVRPDGLNPGDEMIEFDISGPKGNALVRVFVSPLPGELGRYRRSQAKKITVVLDDDTEIDVPPPKEEEQPEP